MPRIVNPNRTMLPKNRRELAALLLKCKAATYRKTADKCKIAPTMGQTLQDVERDLRAYISNIEGAGGDIEYMRGASAPADDVDSTIEECLRAGASGPAAVPKDAPPTQYNKPETDTSEAWKEMDRRRGERGW